MIKTSTLNFSISNRLQKWTLVGAILLCTLTVIGAPSDLYSSEEVENTVVVPPGAYEMHLPKEIYEVCLKQHLIETDAFANVIPQENADGAHKLIIRINDAEEQFITIAYRSRKVLNNMRYIEIAYRKGDLFGYAFIDGEGKDHVFRRPFSDEQITDIANFILDKIFPVFQE